MTDPGWGLLPDQVISRLVAREWDARRRLKARLKGERPFPLTVSLRAPSGQQALTELGHFHRFIDSWRAFAIPSLIQWEEQNYRQLGQQSVPIKLMVPDIASLAMALGETQQHELYQWQSRIGQFLAEPFVQDAELKRLLFELLVDHLEEIERFTDQDLERFLRLLPQMHAGMGGGGYLRALPLSFVDTKFVEQNARFIEQVMNLVHRGAVDEAGGLLSWLDCQSNPKGWLTVRPLDEKVQQALGGLPILQMDTDTLVTLELPAGCILVVENMQAGLALPPMEDTIAVFGGGKNVSWLSADWLKEKCVGYWGDIDSEGFAILSGARRKLPSILSLMMDETTVQKFRDRMVDEPASVFSEPADLKPEELTLFRDLRSGRYGKARLEQERISPDFVRMALSALRVSDQV